MGKWLALLIAISGAALAADTVTKRYALPDKTSLQLSVPASWKDEVRREQAGAPPTIVFTPRQGAGFQVLVTPIWRPRPDMPLATREQVRASVQRAADEAKRDAVENTLPLVEFAGASGSGYYFSATDKAPAPGDFKYLTEGMLQVEDLTVAFTILANEGQQDITTAALDMVKSAARVQP
jgi:hypothetical protein